ncbi:hypothetical protein [Hymenobacter elongatus]|uniref:Uncharacterized protein n=1 Tax=Hymenobacter elongatus TaxID=877208 RepID=A0A4Z0PNR5_9BACT|nr:hypothetical protein [Hymenobacter elongatus]TGE16947.1 hypothetical protein E5J99_08120 [Hymenobacter elongatus]
MQQASTDVTIDGQVVKVGQVIYFTYVPGPRIREAICTQNTVPLLIPHLVLSNAGTTACPTAADR